MTTIDGSETLLLVDDEPAILTLMSRMLTTHGYCTIEASHGAEALQIADLCAPIHLLVTDIVMPTMQRFELATTLQLVHPEAKVLFLTGYTRRLDSVVRGLACTQYPFLLKPFTGQALREKVRNVLDPSSATMKSDRWMS